MLTRKHFKLMAATVSKIENLDERKKMAEMNARICQKANPRFDLNRFNTACGV